MSAHAYSEEQLVEQPAIGLFAALGWQTVSALEETFGANGLLGRETKGEAVLMARLRAALVKLNSGSLTADWERSFEWKRIERGRAAPRFAGGDAARHL